MYNTERFAPRTPFASTVILPSLSVNSVRSMSLFEKGFDFKTIPLSSEFIVVYKVIYKLAEEDFQITLSISLHASSDEIRNKIMPVNKRWGVDELLDACRAYFTKTGRRISFEYTLIAGENDSEENALALAKKLNSKLRTRTETMPIHVNLIPVNPVKERDFKKSGKEQIKKFAKVLESKGIRATVRRTLGADINASCGQLRRDEMKKATPNSPTSEEQL